MIFSEMDEFRNCFGRKQTISEANPHVAVELEDLDVVEHLMPLNELALKLNISIDENHLDEAQGLSQSEVQKRQLERGKNTLTPPKQKPEIVKFALQFTNLFMVLLIAAGLLGNIAYALDTSQPLNLWLGVALCCLVLLGVAWCCLVLLGVVGCCLVLLGIAWCCWVLLGVDWC